MQEVAMVKPETSIAEALNRAHVALMKDLNKLHEAAKSDSGEGVVALIARLGDTRAHLMEHFRFEEQNGYLDVVGKCEPRLQHVIEQLAAEHRQLQRTLDQLIADARAAGNCDDSIRDKIRCWINEVRQHEARETDLVQDAFYTEIAAED
jgi:hypothetical protein